LEVFMALTGTTPETLEAQKAYEGAEICGTVTTSFSGLAVRNVLLATDFSSISEAALPYAAAISRHFGSTLHVAHVLSDAGLLMMSGGIDYVSLGTIYEDAHTEAKEKLERITLCLGEMPHRCHVRHGQVWKNLAEIVETNRIDLLIVGTHGRSGFGKLLLGSVAEDILRHAVCPVLTVGPQVCGRAKLPALEGKHRDIAPVDLELREILYATNFSPDAARSARAAVRLAEEFHAHLTVLHVIEKYSDPGSHPGPMEDGLRHLQELIPENARLQYAPERELEFGSAGENILRVASDREADMIVLGARAALEVGSTHLPWSTAHHVLAHAHCPVLTVRG
jgi:nucleotide-binding universal stress UspA family protein